MNALESCVKSRVDTLRRLEKAKRVKKAKKRLPRKHVRTADLKPEGTCDLKVR